MRLKKTTRGRRDRRVPTPGLARPGRLTVTLALAGWLVVLPLACGEDEGVDPPSDSAAHPDADVLPAGLTVPTPQLTPCPAAWREVDPTGEWETTRCDPWPMGGRQVCQIAEAHFPGRPGCEPVGSACPADGWPAQLPDDRRVLYVKPDALPGSVDGSREAPYGTIGAALAVAHSGDIVALAEGTYDQVVEIGEGITLWGACPEQTHITTSEAVVGEGYAGATIEVQGADVTLRDVRVSGVATAVRVAENAVSTEIDGLVVSDWGTASKVEDGADPRRAGVWLEPGAGLVGRRLSIRDPRVLRVELPGFQNPGIRVEAGAEVEIETVSLEQDTAQGLWATGPGARVALSDLAVFRLPAEAFQDEDPDERLARVSAGFDVDDAELILHRAALENASIRGRGANVSMELQDVLLVSEADSLDGGARGLSLDGGSLRVERVVFRDYHRYALTLREGARAELADLVIDTVRSDANGPGLGLVLEPYSGATAERLLIVGAEGVGVLVAPFASFDGEGVTLSVTRPAPCGAYECAVSNAYGTGLVALDRAWGASVRRFRISSNDLCGVQVAPDANMDLSQGIVERNRVGANVQDPSFDVDRLTDRVVYRDNERNFDSDHLPLPPPAALQPEEQEERPATPERDIGDPELLLPGAWRMNIPEGMPDPGDLPEWVFNDDDTFQYRCEADSSYPYTLVEAEGPDGELGPAVSVTFNPDNPTLWVILVLTEEELWLYETAGGDIWPMLRTVCE